LPIILGVSLVGVIAVSPTAFAGLLVTGFGLAGWLMKQWDYPAAPLVLGLVLGDPMERALRQSLMMSQGDLSIPISRGGVGDRARAGRCSAVDSARATPERLAHARDQIVSRPR
jgi:hypothetical protein